jgi:hypothetical protein
VGLRTTKGHIANSTELYVVLLFHMKNLTGHKDLTKKPDKCSPIINYKVRKIETILIKVLAHIFEIHFTELV